MFVFLCIEDKKFIWRSKRHAKCPSCWVKTVLFTSLYYSISKAEIIYEDFFVLCFGFQSNLQLKRLVNIFFVSFRLFCQNLLACFSDLFLCQNNFHNNQQCFILIDFLRIENSLTHLTVWQWKTKRNIIMLFYIT